MKSILLSHILKTTTPLYGNSGKTEIDRISMISEGRTSNNSCIKLTSHSGTHIDAPNHFDDKGKTLDQFPPNFWICNHPHLINRIAAPGEIIDLSNWQKEIELIPPKTDILLIKTEFENYRDQINSDPEKTYIFKGPGISPDIGNWLRVNRKLKMIGFDFISLSSYSNRELGKKAHCSFLSKSDNQPIGDPVLVIEDMCLANLKATPSKVIVSPLLFENADGSPVTILAIQ